MEKLQNELDLNKKKLIQLDKIEKNTNNEIIEFCYLLKEKLNILKKKLSENFESDKSFARVIYNFYGESENELSLKKGDIVTILEKHEDGWWGGECNGIQGYFPCNFIEIIDNM